MKRAINIPVKQKKIATSNLSVNSLFSGAGYIESPYDRMVGNLLRGFVALHEVPQSAGTSHYMSRPKPKSRDHA